MMEQKLNDLVEELGERHFYLVDKLGKLETDLRALRAEVRQLCGLVHKIADPNAEVVPTTLMFGTAAPIPPHTHG